MSHLTCVGKETEELKKITKATLKSPSPVPGIELRTLYMHDLSVPKCGVVQEMVSGNRGDD